ncbi:hypothetical protein [Trinickia soli]|nr:hypothetical protein [Trinickia soli]CAB3711458.1 hypothetical protein LMG24076_04019 [Trinickia soli]
MPYTLKESDGTHTQIDVSNGNRQDNADGTFWVTGWGAARQHVQVGSAYTLVFPDGHSNSVTVKEIGGAGMGGIRFKFTG